MSINTVPIEGYFPSLMLDRMVHFKSLIEGDVPYFLEYWKHVLWYKEQPFVIDWQLPDGRWTTYTPDYEVLEIDIDLVDEVGAYGKFKSYDACLEMITSKNIPIRKVLLECKPKAKEDDSHTVQQIEIGEAWSPPNGYEFRMAYDEDLRSGHALATIKALWKYARVTTPKDIVWAVNDYLRQKGGESTIHELCCYLTEDGNPLVNKQYIYNLLFHHYIEIDIDRPLTLDQKVYMPSAFK